MSTKNTASLSDTCKRYLGKPLLQTSQISDWKKRPLTEDQLHYASLDAHCLIGILDALLLEKGIDCGLQVALPQYNIEQWISENLETIQLLQSGKPLKQISKQPKKIDDSEDEHEQDEA